MEHNDTELEFKELANDASFVARMTQFHNSIAEIDNVLSKVKDPELYEKLSNADKIQYNLLMSYSLNSLFWMYLRAEGLDPTKHQIRNENERLKSSVARSKQIRAMTSRPRLDKDAANRFVRNGLWVPVPTPEEPSENADSTMKENWDNQ